MEIILVLHNIRSTYNVGAILRTAEGMGVGRVIFSGYTPRVDDQKLLPHLREKINKQIEKSALGAERMVENYACSDIKTEILRLKKEEGFRVVGLENNLMDEAEKERIFKIGRVKMSEILSALNKRVVLILGEEVAGIEKPLREMCDVFLEIPMEGRKESFNVSVAAGMALLYLRLLEEEKSSSDADDEKDQGDSEDNKR